MTDFLFVLSTYLLISASVLSLQVMVDDAGIDEVNATPIKSAIVAICLALVAPIAIMIGVIKGPSR